MAESTRNVQVVLKTKTAYPIPLETYMLPVSWRRFHLSQLINKVLSLPTPIPFDFIIHGEILQSSLGEWCADNTVGEVWSSTTSCHSLIHGAVMLQEEILQVEYIQSVLPPQQLSSLPQSDWVSSISCQKPGYVCIP